MMNNDDKQQLNLKRNILITAISEVISELVNKSGKSGRKISAEYDIGLGMLSKLMRGKSDIKYTTLWKLSNALHVNPLELSEMIMKKLPKDFNFFES
jgi:transcriptional regulator with XRE-family HTH domain